MKRIIIRNLQGVMTHMGQAEDPDIWINAILPTRAWGLPERVKWKDQCTGSEIAEGGSELEVPSKKYFFLRDELDPESEYFKYDEDCSAFEILNSIRSEDFVRIQVTIPAQYSITIEDMQAEIDAENQRRAAMLVLKQRVRELSQMSDLTTAQVKEAVFKLIKFLYLQDLI